MTNITKSNIGLAVISFNRPEYLLQCLASLNRNGWGGATHKYIVDDCSNFEGHTQFFYDLHQKYPHIKILRLPENKGVAAAKNNALLAMAEDGCEHFFLMEDDILMTNGKTCLKYIEYAQVNKIEHLNFGLHGPMNVGKQKTLQGVAVYPDCVGAFSYYTKNCLEVVGFMDTNFKNAWEHVEHTYRIAEAKLTTPFWYFADHIASDLMLQEIPGSIDHSSIRPRTDWQQNISDGKSYWIQKHGSFLPPRPKW
jgi:glycosyltransferase involved in cell wall biosynthesis